MNILFSNPTSRFILSNVMKASDLDLMEIIIKKSSSVKI